MLPTSSHVEEMKVLLNFVTSDVCFVSIYGIDGLNW